MKIKQLELNLQYLAEPQDQESSRQILLGKYISLENFCTCTKTYKKFSTSIQINPFPKNPETLIALKELNQFIIDPIIDEFGLNNFQLTYGFCSSDLKRYLNQKDSLTGIKNGRIDPSRDQHMSCEINSKGNYYCNRLGAACDFLIINVDNDKLIEWIKINKLPFDRIYYYRKNRPIHISYGYQHKREIWTFTKTGQPIRY